MKRADFLKSIIGGAVVAALSPALLVEKTIPVEVDAFKPNCYSFKITGELYYKFISEQPLTGITRPLHPLDQLCKDLTGYPIKEIGFEGDDFPNNYYTVVSFRQEAENIKLYLNQNV